jgi:hypothetical protein
LITLLIAGLEDLAHAAGAELVEDLEGADRARH